MYPCTELEGHLEKLLVDSRSEVAAAVATLMSASVVVRDNTEQIRHAMEAISLYLLSYAVTCVPQVL